MTFDEQVDVCNQWLVMYGARIYNWWGAYYFKIAPSATGMRMMVRDTPLMCCKQAKAYHKDIYRTLPDIKD